MRFRFLALLGAMTVAPSLLLAATFAPDFHDGWQLQSSCTANEKGEAISTPAYRADSWLTTRVPSTVLAAQVAAKQLPDPYFGENLRKLPGANYPIGANFSNLPMPDDSPYRCGWWYRKSFHAGPAPSHGDRTWLHFDGINYRGELWMNGKLLADRTRIAGAYRTYDFDVTDTLQQNAENTVAIEVFAPTEKELGINWVDWNPCPPDKDMGLWGDVRLENTGTVTVKSPLAVTHFEDDSLRNAELTVYAELNNASDHIVRGTVHGTAAGARFDQAVELQPHEQRTVAFTPAKFPVLNFKDVKPWWPWQMGEPHLEQLSIAFNSNGITTEEAHAEFGFRTMTSELTGNGSRLFRINGKPILIRGAGWSQDMLLRTDDKRLADQIKLVRDMNLNTIRLEGKLETEEFFRLADHEGLLVMLGWCCCDHWEQWSTWNDEDHAVSAASLRDQLLRLRSHASLLVWLNGSDNAPPADVEAAYLKVEQETHWPNPTLSAAATANTAGAGPNGVKMTGPYDYVAPSYWYQDTNRFGGAWGFNTETSPGPAIPSLASRKLFLSDPEAWPASAAWRLHYGGGGFDNLRVMDDAMVGTYARPQNAAEYERMAQTMAYDSERAMFEAYSRNKYQSTGVVQWMLNNAWPSMIWHLYDYYLNADAGYFATKKACEPLHIQYSYDDRSIAVVNSTYKPVSALHAMVTVHNRQWQELYKTDVPVSVAADGVLQVAQIPERLYMGTERILLVDLQLKDSSGNTVSRNFYWVPVALTTFDWNRTDYTHTPALRYEDLATLTQLPKAKVDASANITGDAKSRTVHVMLQNDASGLAFQVRAALRTADGGLIAPVLWSDNWIEIAPGEKTELTAILPAGVRDANVQVEGWNVDALTVHPTQ